jgi:hypothetical protein
MITQEIMTTSEDHAVNQRWRRMLRQVDRREMIE